MRVVASWNCVRAEDRVCCLPPCRALRAGPSGVLKFKRESRNVLAVFRPALHHSAAQPAY